MISDSNTLNRNHNLHRNPFCIRIRRLGLNLIIEDNISVIHQYHGTFFWERPDAEVLTEKNRSLLHNVTLRETTCKANSTNNWGQILWNGI